MSRHIGRIWLTVAILVAITAGIASAYDYTIKGSKPDWWDDTSGCVTWTKAEWTTWSEWVTGFGAAPDSFEADFGSSTPLGPLPYPGNLNERWQWAGNARYQENVDEDGILVNGHDDEWDFGLVLGNKNLAPTKLWYLEFELDGVPSGNWDPDRFSYEAIGRYADSVKDFPFTVLDSGWKTLTDDTSGNDYLVWWGTFKLEPQSDLDKFLWKWNTNTVGEGVDDFYIRRVTTGTCCTPEPVSMALLALGLPAGLLVRRRTSRK